MTLNFFSNKGLQVFKTAKSTVLEQNIDPVRDFGVRVSNGVDVATSKQ